MSKTAKEDRKLSRNNNNNKSAAPCSNEKCHFQSWGPHIHRMRERNEKNVYSDVLKAIGNTPLIKLNKIPKEAGLKCDVYVKCEFQNPGGSIKDRMALRMLEEAEEKGLLNPGSTLIEPTSGNTGIGLALVCAIKGYKCIIVMPEKASYEREATIKALGAQIVRAPNVHPEHPDSIYNKAKRLNSEIPNSVILGQFTNINNPLAHYDVTAEEIIEQCDGKVDMLVVAAGTGGTMSGLSYKLKERYADCEIVGVDPVGSQFALPESLNVTDVTFYEVEGIGDKCVWDVMDRRFVSRWFKIDDRTSFETSRRLIRKEGILAGGSSGAILAGALMAAKGLKKGQKCVVILPDGIRNYMTKFVNDNWMEANGFKEVVNEHNHWWWNHKVSDLHMQKVEPILLNTTCEEALNFLKSNGLTHVPVKSTEGLFEGVLNLKYLTKQVVSQNYQLNERSMENIISKKIYRVTKKTTLSLVSRILEVEDFVIVVDKKDRPIGSITHIQLLKYIASKANKPGKM